jgi:hypothetical protein
MSRKMRRKRNKKKLIRNILIAVAAAALIVAGIILGTNLRKDAHGLNGFQRRATAATADGVRVSMIEYAVTFDTIASDSQIRSMSDEQLRTLQENAAKQALLIKICEKEAKALGLELSEEDAKACDESAENEIKTLEDSIRKRLIENGSYSQAAYEKQITAQFDAIGMSRSAYYEFARRNAAATKYAKMLQDYYKENGSGIAEEELLAYYRETVEKTMTGETEDGGTKSAYEEGMFWMSLQYFSNGLTLKPMLYVPEGFLYIDFIRLNKSSLLEANELVEKVKSGEIAFDTLMASEENLDPYRTVMRAPYPIAEHDHKALFEQQEIYTAAAELAVGEIGSYVGKAETAEDGTETVPVYLFRRADGAGVCMDGDSGVIDIDYYTGVRQTIEADYRNSVWFSDVSFADAIYSYKGYNR